MSKPRVLIVDDSTVVRAVLREMLSTDPEIEVVGEAADPYEARDKIKATNPTVLTLDVEMPRMDGITFLRNLMRLNPLPVIMLSSLTGEGAETTLQALEIGAVDYMPKPTAHDDESKLDAFQFELINKVKNAAASYHKVKHLSRVKSAAKPQPSAPKAHIGQLRKFAVIAIGSSTGGTEALREVLQSLPSGLPPIVIAQHIPGSFSARLAERLNSITRVRVVEAKNLQVMEPGHAYLAPGDAHLRVEKNGGLLRCRLGQDAPVNRHRPSVEALFDSLMPIAPEAAVAIMLTGMGEDGSMAMKRLRDAGAYTICQDEHTSLVWGMPGAAVRYGGACEQAPLNRIGERLIRRFANKQESKV
ncbi:MAG TPA: chemotaxis response regulator protein-glutamate methylesterase [Marinobacterium sp.]|nr:chemotaxis response regulator protein-glutamate methylesterase [Marinobacterium sp.]